MQVNNSSSNDTEHTRHVALSVAHTLFDQLSDSVIVLDTDGRVVRWNRAAELLYGWCAAEVVGHPVRAFLTHEQYLTDDPAIAERTLLHNGRWSGIVTQQHRAGHEMLVEMTAHQLRDASGVQGIMVIARTRAHADRELVTQAQVLTSVLDALVMVDTAGIVTYWNAAAARMYGVSAAEAIGLLTSQLYTTLWYDPADQQRVVAAIARQERWSGRVRQRRRDGREIIVTASISTVHNLRVETIGVLVTVHDITAQVQAEQRLQLLAELSREFATASLDLPVLTETIARRLAAVTGDGCSIRLLRDDGQTLDLVALAHSDTAVQQVLYQFVHEPLDIGDSMYAVLLQGTQLSTVVALDTAEFRARLQPPYPALFDTIQTVYVLVVRLQVRGMLLGALTVFRVRDRSPVMPAEQKLAEDLADRAALAIASACTFGAAEHDLALLDSVLTTAPVGIGFWDTTLHCVRVNAALAAADALPVSAYQGQPISALTTPIARVLTPLLAQVIASGEPLIDREITDAVAGSVRQRSWLVSIYAVYASNGDRLGAGVILVELTARKQLESQVLQSQKMESIGRLTGGIAHEFNNLLTSISGYADLILADLPATDPLAADIREIQRASIRATNLTRQLLAFARKQIVALQPTDLNQLIRDLSRLIGRLIGEHILLTTHLAAALDHVRADTGQIEQVLVNLAVNARDAMPLGGRLMISTANVWLTQSLLSDHGAIVEGQYVLIAVADTGSGMDVATRAHAFEPFFTTKPVGTGTGLGLATCYGIVTQHGGYIWLYSEPDRGTVVRVYLPRIETDHEPRVSSTPVRTLHGHETILIAEDEAVVRQLAARVLRGLGYTVIEATDGRDALRLARLHSPQPIDLLLTDIVMPMMSGTQLAQAITAWYPQIRVLYTSGYTSETISLDQTFGAEVVFLQKPFASHTLAERIRDLLDT